MKCLGCDEEMEQTDTTYSEGEHTGDIYTCENCELHFLSIVTSPLALRIYDY